MENPQTIASFAINTERYKLPKDFYSNYLKKVEAVTVEDIQAVSKKYILPEKSIILVIGKASEVAEKLNKFSSNGKVEYYDIEANLYDPASNKKELPAGITAPSIIKKYIETIGGEASIRKVQDILMKGKISMGAMNINMVMTYKIPGKYIMEVSMNGQVMQKEVLNGEIGRQSGMQGDKELSGEDLERLKQSANPFMELDYGKLGYKTELKEIAKIDDKDAYKIEITSPGNVVSTDYYSVETGLKIRTESTMDAGPNGKSTVQMNFLEYSEVNGVKYPKKMQQVVGPQTFNLLIDEVLINSGIKDEIFK